MTKFIVSKFLTKVTNIVAPIALMDDYSVHISTQNFMSCGNRCTSVDVHIYFFDRNIDGKVVNVYSTSFTSWSETNNKENMKFLKKFVNALITQYYEIIH